MNKFFDEITGKWFEKKTRNDLLSVYPYVLMDADNPGIGISLHNSYESAKIAQRLQRRWFNRETTIARI